MDYMLNFREVTYALSEALDLVGIDDIRHGKRVAFMAAECARIMGKDQRFIDEIISIGMLHDCGVSNTDVHEHLVIRLEWKDEQLHCIRGADLLHHTALLNPFSKAVYYHHTHWDELKNLPVDETVKLQAALIYLVDRVDALRVQIAGSDLEKRDEIERIISEHSGTFFYPEAVRAFLTASQRNSFWFYLTDEPLEGYLMEWVEGGGVEQFPFATVREVAQMFADIVDAKSPFTFEHSLGVAALSNYLAKLLALDEAKREAVEIAALLHDLGKLRIHDDVLNKHGRLDEKETGTMHRHGFDSNMILRRIRGFRQIALIASLHHETLDGKGYPYSLEGDAIPLEARIVTVADIFQALIQDRPYRGAMPPEKAYGILREMVDSGKIDDSVVTKIGEDIPKAYELARCRERKQVG